MKPLLFCILLLFASCAPTNADAKPPTSAAKNPVELGYVEWGRDLNAAKKASKTSGKPVLILFDEVPGCNTVVGFGKDSLRDPLIVEAIETEFEPVVVYNNVSGKDRKILKSYDEPTWNNPVVRIFDWQNKELTTRFAGPYNKRAFVKTLVAGIKAAARPVPQYLSDYGYELSANTKKAVFGMYCFWTGERKFAEMDGVISTRPGFLHGHEVVEVTYDPGKINYATLVSKTKSSGAADTAFYETERQRELASKKLVVKAKKQAMRFSKKDDKYQLKGTPYSKLQLTPRQATKINAAVASRGKPEQYLSARQRKQLGN